MNKVKYTHIAKHYTPRKITNLHNMKENFNKYKYIIALNIDNIPAHIQSELRNKLYNEDHYPFKIVNKIAIKVFNLNNLNNIIKGQILYIGSEDLHKVMKVCSSFANIKPIVGISMNQLIDANSLMINGKFNRSQLIGLIYKSLFDERIRSIINIFEALNA